VDITALAIDVDHLVRPGGLLDILEGLVPEQTTAAETGHRGKVAGALARRGCPGARTGRDCPPQLDLRHHPSPQDPPSPRHARGGEVIQAVLSRFRSQHQPRPCLAPAPEPTVRPLYGPCPVPPPKVSLIKEPHYRPGPAADPVLVRLHEDWYAAEALLLAGLMDATAATDPWTAARRTFGEG
jgi:hypothetical protein